MGVYPLAIHAPGGDEPGTVRGDEPRGSGTCLGLGPQLSGPEPVERARRGGRNRPAAKPPRLEPRNQPTNPLWVSYSAPHHMGLPH
eukprot:gene19911-biopygen16082